MYKPVKAAGDGIEVPQLLFSRLTAQGADDGRFRVALYIFGGGGAGVSEIASALRLPKAKVEAALNYWEGAGLIERQADENAQSAEIPIARKRTRLTTRETVAAGNADPRLKDLLSEVQRLFGRVIGEKDINLFATLYTVDEYPAELILMAAAEGSSKNITRPAAYTESVLKDWRGQGVNDCAAADALLRLRAGRETREKALAQIMGLEWDPFTLAEKRRIAQWHEEYGYTMEMVEAARMAAGEKSNDVRYLAGILKKWYSKGYKTPKDVQQGDENLNLRAAPSQSVPPQDDILAQASGYVPLKKRSRRL